MCPDEIVTEFPQLRLADVSAAVAYYHDNRELIDRQINESVEGADGRGVHPTSDLLLLD
jgi:hypothetical protein